MKLRIAGITKESIVDGPGVRYVIFTQGCFHKCPGCHNPETHDPDGGYETDSEDIYTDICKSSYLRGVTFSGGEPFLQADALANLAHDIKQRGLDIVTYTGYTFEELILADDPGKRRLLDLTDILIDGKFKISDKDLSLKFRGSRNQRIIDVKSSLVSNSPVLFMGGGD